MVKTKTLLLKIFPGTGWTIWTKHEHDMKNRRLKPIIRSNFTTYAFIRENVTMMDSLEMFASYDLEFGLYTKLKNYTNMSN